MTVESNYVIAIATFSGWLKTLAPVFQPMRIKTKSNRAMYAWFFPRFQRVTDNCWELWLVERAACSCCDWSEYCFGFGLSTVIWKPLYLKIGTTITIEHNVRYRCKKVLRLGGGNSPNNASLLSWTLRAMALMLSPILLGSGITNSSSSAGEFFPDGMVMGTDVEYCVAFLTCFSRGLYRCSSAW